MHCFQTSDSINSTLELIYANVSAIISKCLNALVGFLNNHLTPSSNLSILHNCLLSKFLTVNVINHARLNG